MRRVLARRRAAARSRSDERGVALLTVVMAMAILSIFLLSSLAYTLQNSAPARRDQDSKIAVAAAQAGIDEYVGRLNSNSEYWSRGNVDSANPALASSGTGTAVPGTGSSSARYRYQLVNTPNDIAQTGIIRLRVTGLSSPAGRTPVERTLTATLRPKGFLSFIYLSDYEVTDPALNGTSLANCTKYYFGDAGDLSTTSDDVAGRSTSSCSNIQWTANDIVDGPLHSNDALQINGRVTFKQDPTESSWPVLDASQPGTGKPYPAVWRKPSSTAMKWWSSTNPLFSGPLGTGSKTPKFSGRIEIPSGNLELLDKVTPGPLQDKTGPGCYYQGTTKITFVGTKMKVLSPSTTLPGTPARCLVVSNRQNEQTVDIPPVIYVDQTSTLLCAQVGLPLSTSLAATTEVYTPGGLYDLIRGTTTNYDCHRGSAHVSGTVNGQVTISTVNDIVVTGNLTVADLNSTNVIGLIAGDCVWVHHPVNSSGDEVLSAANRVTTIHAAILSLNHSFVVQNWNKGDPLGTLNVVGAISQKFRGPVGTGSGTTIATGYAKSYKYDPRLAYLQPPYFLKPTSSPWGVTSVTDG